MKENNSTAENSRPNQHSKHTHSHTKSRKRRRRSSSSGRPSGHVIFVIVFSIILVVTIVGCFSGTVGVSLIMTQTKRLQSSMLRLWIISNLSIRKCSKGMKMTE